MMVRQSTRRAEVNAKINIKINSLGMLSIFFIIDYKIKNIKFMISKIKMFVSFQFL